jgi:hypothetical protein
MDAVNDNIISLEFDRRIGKIARARLGVAAAMSNVRIRTMGVVHTVAPSVTASAGTKAMKLVL